MTGTHINYFFLCKRKLWLFANSIAMEHTSDTVAIGKTISDTTYTRRRHELKIDDIALDFYDARTRTIHEIKKSKAMEQSHVWQVKYYISVLERKGITGVTGEINYPKLKQKHRVELTDADRRELQSIERNVEQLIARDTAPPLLNKPLCKKCSYYELCYV